MQDVIAVIAIVVVTVTVIVIVVIMTVIVVIVTVIVDDLVAIHRVGGKTEILLPGTTEEDHVLHLLGTGGWMSIQTRIGSAGISPRSAGGYSYSCPQVEKH